MHCQYCTGIVEDGFCDTCGKAPAGAATQIGAAPESSSRTGAASSPASSRTGSARSSRSTRRGTSSRRRAGLGAGLLDLPTPQTLDPLQAIMAEPVVPERKRFCQAQARASDLYTPTVLRSKGLRPDEQVTCNAKLTYEKGFCPQCGQQYTFVPGLKAGDLVAGKYEVKGPMAFGGLGWIYLAWDRDLARWVVLKGLLNAKDATHAAVAMAERRALAAVKHPNIVGIYDFVSHGVQGFIVMEYVGGKTLMAMRKERGALPVAEACAYMLGILPAFAYLHQQGLAYMDFKPENVMLEGDRVVLVDLGAVHKIDDPTGDLYATAGYSSPEGEPTPTHDLFTVGRALAVLAADFKYSSQYEYTLPPAKDVPAFATHLVFHRFLEKATRKDPDLRFQTADEMAEQLRGVLRLLVAETSPVPPAESTVYSGDLQELVGKGTNRVTGRALPTPRVDPEDPAAGLIVSAAAVSDLNRRTALLRNGLKKFTQSIELPLQVATTLIEEGNFGEAERQLHDIERQDPFEWRVTWLRGRMLLAQGKPADARRLFEQVEAELPGELAPKLAIAMAAEADGDFRSAATAYEMVCRTDSTFTTATFGLARCKARLGDRPGASAAYGLIPSTSSRYVEAQLARARVLIDAQIGPPAVQDLQQASHALEAIREVAEGPDLHRTAADLLLAAVVEIKGQAITPNGVVLLETPLEPVALRRGAEAHLRQCARYARTREERVALVDSANAVRPRTLW